MTLTRVLIIVCLSFLSFQCKKKTTLIRVDGSSTVFPITEAVSEEFQKQTPQVKVTVGISGTGGGFKKFCNGETDISDASRPIKASEVELCQKNAVEYIELPVAYDGLAVVVNVQNDWLKSITVNELKKMWEPQAQGKIMKWSDVNPVWPQKDLHLYGAGVDSGTYDYFTEAIIKKEHSSRGDYTSSEDDNTLVQGVSGDVGSLGFFGLAYYLENQKKLKLIAVDDEKDDNGVGPILAAEETVRNGSYQPLSRPIFIYVSKKSLLDSPAVAQYVQFYLNHAEKLVKDVGYIPLPTRAYQLANNRVQKRMIGSMFKNHGSQVGVSIEQLLSQE